MLEPTTLPKATSLLPLRLAFTDTANSGALVPKATTVRPMTMGEMPSRSAMAEAPRTRKSAPNTRSTTPIRRRGMVRMSTKVRVYHRYSTAARTSSKMGFWAANTSPASIKRW